MKSISLNLLLIRKKKEATLLYMEVSLKSISRDSVMSLLILFVSISIYLIHKEIENG